MMREVESGHDADRGKADTVKIPHRGRLHHDDCDAGGSAKVADTMMPYWA